MPSRRALLYVPGDDWKKINKATTLDVDCICLDMEDGVAASRKAEARTTIARALQELNFGRSEKVVRINAVGSGLEAGDLAAVLPYHPQGIVLPKAEEPPQIQWVHERVEAAELKYGWPLHSIRMLIGVETPRAILNLKEIASHPRLDALIFGGEDYAAALGATRTPEAVELLYARLATLNAAAAYGLQAIDMVMVDFRDLQALRAEAGFGARLGFAGKQVIHPDQIAPVQEAFTPCEEAIAQAQRIISAFDAVQRQGRGVLALDGRMIDLPLVKAAHNVLDRARAAGKVV